MPSEAEKAKAEEIKRLQEENYNKFFLKVTAANYPRIQKHADVGFDWWIFPSFSKSDFGKKYCVDQNTDFGREVYKQLATDDKFVERYLSSIRIYFDACGWDVASRSAKPNSAIFAGYSIRFYKLMESFLGMTAGNERLLPGLQKAQQDNLFLSLRQFADLTEQKGGADANYGVHYEKLVKVATVIETKKAAEAAAVAALQVRQGFKPEDDVRKSADGNFTQASSVHARDSQQDALLVGIVENENAKKNPQAFMKREIKGIVKRHKKYTNGSTLVSALVTNENNELKITTGYLGDARAAVVVKYQKGGVEHSRSILLTEDHHPSLERVKTNIESQGVSGSVFNGRVNGLSGSLGTGGAVGDSEFHLLRDPDVHTFKVADFLETGEELIDLDLVVSCDGLWENDGLVTDQKYKKTASGEWKKVAVTTDGKKTLTACRDQAGGNFADHLLDEAKEFSGDNISVVTASIIKGGEKKVAKGQAVMAIVCDGHGDGKYEVDPEKDDQEKADGWVVSSSAAAQLAAISALQPIPGLEVDKEKEPFLKHYLSQYTTWSREREKKKAEIKPGVNVEVMMVQPFGIGGYTTIWDQKDNRDRGRSFRMLNGVYVSQQEMIDSFSSIMLKAAQEFDLTKDEVNRVFRVAKEFGGVGNIKTDKGYETNTTTMDPKLVNFSAACQEYAQQCGFYTGRQYKEPLKKPMVGCRLTFFPDEALIDFNKKDLAQAEEVQKAEKKFSEISAKVISTIELQNTREVS